MKKIILASGSPRRRELLDQMGLEYDVILSKVDESSSGELPPSELVQVLARMKAKAVAKKIRAKKEEALVIGADTIVVLEGQVLGKPENNLDAEKMLERLSGIMHKVYTGVAIVDVKSATEEVFVQKTNVYMKSISQEEITAYVLTGEPLDKAGSYGIQGKGGVFIEKIEGDYFSVMGLPISKLYESLKKFY